MTFSVSVEAVNQDGLWSNRTLITGTSSPLGMIILCCILDINLNHFQSYALTVFGKKHEFESFTKHNRSGHQCSHVSFVSCFGLFLGLWSFCRHSIHRNLGNTFNRCPAKGVLIQNIGNPN